MATVGERRWGCTWVTGILGGLGAAEVASSSTDGGALPGSDRGDGQTRKGFAKVRRTAPGRTARSWDADIEGDTPGAGTPQER